MTRMPVPTWEDLPEYPTDDEIGAVVLGSRRARDFGSLATLRERDGMPKIDPFWGGRPKWMVKLFLEKDQRLTAETPQPRHGIEGRWTAGRGRRLPA